jgi:hypothetical protein
MGIWKTAAKAIIDAIEIRYCSQLETLSPSLKINVNERA